MRRLWHKWFGHGKYRIADNGDGMLQPRCLGCGEYFGLKFHGIRGKLNG